MAARAAWADSRSDLREDVLSRRLADGHYRWVADLALDRDGEELLSHARGSADDAHLILTAKLGLDDRRCRDDSQALLREVLGQRAIVALSNDARPYALAAEPLLKRAAHGGRSTRH